MYARLGSGTSGDKKVIVPPTEWYQKLYPTNWRVPYFMDVQIDKERTLVNDWMSSIELFFGFFIMNVGTWSAIVLIDILLLANNFKDAHLQVHSIQLASLVCVSVSGATLLFFFLANQLLDLPFSSHNWKDEEKIAETLPRFATSLITGGLRSTTGFSYIMLLIMIITSNNVATGTAGKNEYVAGAERNLQLIIAQICLKHFGTAMALTNQRLKVYTDMSIVSATS